MPAPRDTKLVSSVAVPGRHDGVRPRRAPSSAFSGLAAHSRSRALLASALLGACVVLGLWLVIGIRSNGPADFYVYYMAGWLVRHGQDVYLITPGAWRATAHELGVTHFTWPYRYPPYVAALVSLLTPFGPVRAMTIWGTANAAALIAGAVVAAVALGGRWRIYVSLALLICFGPVYHTLYDGQVNGLVFLALAVAFWGLARDRDLPVGIGVAVAAALKLTPVALLGYLAWRRRWRALAIGVVALVALTAVSLPLTGVGAYRTYLDRAYQLTDAGHVNPSGANQSVTGTLARLLLPSASRVPAVGAASTVKLEAQLFAAALIVLTAVSTWPSRKDRRTARALPVGGVRRGVGAESDDGPPREELLGFGLVVATSLVIGPFTWYHQFVWLLIPLLALACWWVSARRWWLVVLLAALVVAIDANELLWAGLHQDVIASGLYRALSTPFVATMIVWALAAGALLGWRRRRARPGPTDPAPH